MTGLMIMSIIACVCEAYKISRGRNSVVECQLPKLNSPKNTSIYSIIAYTNPYYCLFNESVSNSTVGLTGKSQSALTF